MLQRLAGPRGELPLLHCRLAPSLSVHLALVPPEVETPEEEKAPAELEVLVKASGQAAFA